MVKLRYRIHFDDTGTNYFEFDADGTWEWQDAERTYDETSNELTFIRRSWRIKGTILAPSNNDLEGWDAFNAFLASMDTRGTGAPVSVDIVLVDDSGPVPVVTTKATLGPPDWEDFRVTALAGLPDADNEAVTWLKAFPVELELQATRSLPEGGGGIAGLVNFEQVIEHSFDAGLETVTWTTLVETETGTDAVALGKTLGLIPIDSYGSNYSYKTNGPDGVAWEELDPDTRDDPDAVVTKVRVTCQIKEWGITVGPVTPGNNPDDYSLEETIEDGEDETVRTITASARGRGAQAWGERQKPAGTLTRSRQGFNSAKLEFTGEWIIATQKSGPNPTVVVVQLSGGHQSFDFEPVSGGFLPVRFDGPLQPWKCEVSIRVTRLGGTGKLAELKLPPLLGAPWSLDRTASVEGAPYMEDAKRDPNKARWARDVRLVFFSAEKPKTHPVDSYLSPAGASVDSYYLG